MTNLREYLKRTPEARVVYETDELHPLLKGKVKATVCFEFEKNYTSGEIKQYFVLFINEEMVLNSIKLYFPIYTDFYSGDNKINIAEEMVKEYKSYCDFKDLDMELEGKCACEKNQGIYSKCDDCPSCYYGAGKDSDDACIGATYSCPKNINFWALEKTLNEKFGPGTPNYKKYLGWRTVALERQAMDLIKEDYSFKKKLLKAIFSIKK